MFTKYIFLLKWETEFIFEFFRPFSCLLLQHQIIKFNSVCIFLKNTVSLSKLQINSLNFPKLWKTRNTIPLNHVHNDSKLSDYRLKKFQLSANLKFVLKRNEKETIYIWISMHIFYFVIWIRITGDPDTWSSDNWSLSIVIFPVSFDASVVRSCFKNELVNKQIS